MRVLRPAAGGLVAVFAALLLAPAPLEAHDKLGANLNFIAFGSPYLRKASETIGLDGQLMSLFVIVLAAAEAAVALAIALNFYNSFSTIDVDRADQLQG